MTETNRELTAYVLARTDLPSMNPGKMAAQVHHAGVQMMANYHRCKMVQDYINDGLAQGANGFNTTIVLGACIASIRHALIMAALTDAVYEYVMDPSYPFIVESEEIANLIPQKDTTKIIKKMDDGRVMMVREEITCAWFVGDRNNEDFRKLFDGFTLHP